MYYFEFPEETYNDLTDKEKFEDIVKYFEKHSSFSYTAQRELLKIGLRLYAKIYENEETLKKINDDMDILKGFKPSKTIKDRVNKINKD